MSVQSFVAFQCAPQSAAQRLQHRLIDAEFTKYLTGDTARLSSTATTTTTTTTTTTAAAPARNREERADSGDDDQRQSNLVKFAGALLNDVAAALVQYGIWKQPVENSMLLSQPQQAQDVDVIPSAFFQRSISANCIECPECVAATTCDANDDDGDHRSDEKKERYVGAILSAFYLFRSSDSPSACCGYTLCFPNLRSEDEEGNKEGQSRGGAPRATATAERLLSCWDDIGVGLNLLIQWIELLCLSSSRSGKWRRNEATQRGLERNPSNKVSGTNAEEQGEMALRDAEPLLMDIRNHISELSSGRQLKNARAQLEEEEAQQTEQLHEEEPTVDDDVTKNSDNNSSETTRYYSSSDGACEDDELSRNLIFRLQQNRDKLRRVQNKTFMQYSRRDVATSNSNNGQQQQQQQQRATHSVAGSTTSTTTTTTTSTVVVPTVLEAEAAVLLRMNELLRAVVYTTANTPAADLANEGCSATKFAVTATEFEDALLRDAYLEQEYLLSQQEQQQQPGDEGNQETTRRSTNTHRNAICELVGSLNRCYGHVMLNSLKAVQESTRSSGSNINIRSPKSERQFVARAPARTALDPRAVQEIKRAFSCSKRISSSLANNTNCNKSFTETNMLLFNALGIASTATGSFVHATQAFLMGLSTVPPPTNATNCNETEYSPVKFPRLQAVLRFNLALSFEKEGRIDAAHDMYLQLITDTAFAEEFLDEELLLNRCTESFELALAAMPLDNLIGLRVCTLMRLIYTCAREDKENEMLLRIRELVDMPRKYLRLQKWQDQNPLHNVLAYFTLVPRAVTELTSYGRFRVHRVPFHCSLGARPFSHNGGGNYPAHASDLVTHLFSPLLLHLDDNAGENNAAATTPLSSFVPPILRPDNCVYVPAASLPSSSNSLTAFVAHFFDQEARVFGKPHPMIGYALYMQPTSDRTILLREENPY